MMPPTKSETITTSSGNQNSDRLARPENVAYLRQNRDAAWSMVAFRSGSSSGGAAALPWFAVVTIEH